MKLNMNMELGKKKEIYPSKKSINLCYQEDVTTQFSTVMLRVIFITVVLVALLKVFVLDVIMERNEALEALEKIQATLNQKMVEIQDYEKVAEEYSRYSYKILIDALDTQDRLDILAMVEDTVFKNGGMSNVSITENVVALSFEGLNLDECAQLIADIQTYEMVETVIISNQTGSADGTYQGNLTITLKPKESEINAGGEQ